MSEQNLNGPFSEIEKTKQFDEKIYQHYNGVHSSQSSRSSSPSVRFGQIPSSQLPPNRPIPQSQLPPSQSSVSAITQQIGGLTVGQMTTTVSSKFSTSTPLQSPANVKLPTISPVVANQTNINSVPSSVPNFAPNHQGTPGIIKPIQDSTGQLIDINPQKNPSQVNGNNGPISQHPVPHITNQLHQQNIVKQTVSYSQSNNQIPPQIPIKPVQSLPNQTNPQNSLLTQSSYQRPQLQTSQSNLNQRPTEPPNMQNSPVVNTNNFNSKPPNQPKFFENTTVASQHNFARIPGTQQTPIYQQNNNFMGTPQLRSGPPLVGVPPPQKSNILSNRYPSGTVGTTQYSQQQQYFSASQQQQPFSQQQQLPQQQPQPAQQQQSSPPPRQQQQYPLPQQQVQQQHYNTQQQPVQQNANTIYQQNNYSNQQTFQSVTHSGFNRLWGTESYDLLQTPNILPPSKIEAPKIHLGNELLDQANCNPDIFRCTMTKIPENNSLLQKSRLPLGVLIHPFRDLNHLPVIQCTVIVRCRACRTYINPYVIFTDNKRWKCNLCYRINELPEEFQYDPVTKTYGDPSRRPEIKSSTLEYIAPAEYMLRPPQPAVYLFLLDVSRLAVESGYLQIVSNTLLEELKNLPGDARTLIGFIAYDSAVHFYSLSEGITQPQEMTVLEIDEIFLPTPDNLLVNLRDRMELIADLLLQLPNRFANTFNTNSALGAALQAAYKMMSALGGRVTVFQASLPNVGPGALTAREDAAQRSSVEVSHLNPVNDFYKRLALECSGQQIAVDLFIVNSQYVDIATISGISRFSGGCIHHFPLLRPSKPLLCESFARSFRRYLSRKVGFEAVMRIRCTRGLSIHTFHGNFFVRSTDLLSLPNINPDAGFGMQVAIDESLSDVQSVCFQAALLYTSSKGERRIRVHTVCLPIASTLHEVINSADQQCIVGLLSKMAVDRSMQSSLSDAREAFINVAIDILSSYKMSLNLGSPASGLLAPNCLRLLSLYISALLKHPAFRIGGSTRLDDRVMAMINMKTKPLYLLMQQIYPDLYPIHELENQQIILNSEEEPISMPPKLQLTARCLENKGAFLMDMGEHMVILVCPNISLEFLNEALGVSSYSAMPDELYEIPILDNLRNQRLHQFISYLNEEKPFVATIQVIRDNSSNRLLFFERLIEDRVENALSYHEFLQHLKTQVK